MAEIKEGPRTGHREFFEEHVNLEIPELSGIKEALGKDDIPAADKIFADYMRKSPDIGKLTAAWKREVQSLSGDRKESFIKKARDIMDYHFVSCGIPYHFADTSSVEIDDDKISRILAIPAGIDSDLA